MRLLSLQELTWLGVGAGAQASSRGIGRPGRELLKGKGKARKNWRACLAEDICIAKGCGQGYQHDGWKYPYSIWYRKFDGATETKFVFRVRPSHTGLPSARHCAITTHHDPFL